MKAWKLLGLAGLAGVAATGAVVARDERRRRAVAPEEVRARLHARHAEVSAPDPSAPDPSTRHPSPLPGQHPTPPAPAPPAVSQDGWSGAWATMRRALRRR